MEVTSYEVCKMNNSNVFEMEICGSSSSDFEVRPASKPLRGRKSVRNFDNLKRVQQNKKRHSGLEYKTRPGKTVVFKVFSDKPCK